MQRIDATLLHRLETLSMLQIEESHKEKVLEELNKFLEFVDILNELDLENVPAEFNVIDSQAPLRPDQSHSEPEIAQKILAHAPKSEEDFFIVPKIIE